VQAAGDLVAVLVELAAGVEHAHDDLGGGALGLVLVVHLDADRDAAAVVGDGDGVVGVDGDDDVVAVAGEGFVDGVIDHFEHHVVQAGAVGGVADVHAGTLAHGLQPFELLDAGFVVVVGGGGLCVSDMVFSVLQVSLDGLAGPGGQTAGGSDSHRHDYVLEIGVVGQAEEGAGVAVVEADLDFVGGQVVEHVEQIGDVEADVEASPL
jgi:hypothetical protein